MNKFLLFFLMLIAFYAIFVGYSDFNKVSENMINFKFEYFPIILLLTFTSFFITGIRQRLLLKNIDIKISFKENMLLFFSGLSMIITPGGSGQLIKSYYLKKKYGIKQSKTLPLVFVERFLDATTIVIVIIFLSIFKQINEIIIIAVVFVVLIILIFISLRNKFLFNKLLSLLKKLPLLSKFGSTLSESHDGFYNMTSGKTMAQSLLISILAISFDASATYLVFIAFDIKLGFVFEILTVYSSLLYGAISLIPGGIGLTELNVVRVLSNAGIETSLATSVIIMIRIFTMWFGTVLGFTCTKLFLKKI
jgi:glycosyltransferase 2 family protein